MDDRKNKTLGTGVGYRPEFRDAFFSSTRPRVSWIEVITENFLPMEGRDTRATQTLRQLRADFPVALHGVGLNLASTDPLCDRYLAQLQWLTREIEPWLVTDHLCWTGVNTDNLFDLYPFPYTAKTLEHVASRVSRVQDFLKRPLAVENITAYLRPSGSEMEEHDFLNELAKRAGCKLLLDVNNVYVNSVNFSFDPLKVLAAVDLRNVAEVHVAGHIRNRDGILLDNHGAAVNEEVWALCEWVQKRGGLIPTMIERDQNIPAWAELDQELERLRTIQKSLAKEKGGKRDRSIERLADAIP